MCVSVTAFEFVEWFLCNVQLCVKDASNFDSEFATEKPILSPTNDELLKTVNQAMFKGFSFSYGDWL